MQKIWKITTMKKITKLLRKFSSSLPKLITDIPSFIVLCFIELHRCFVFVFVSVFFYQIESKTLHLQIDQDSLYGDTLPRWFEKELAAPPIHAYNYIPEYSSIFTLLPHYSFKLLSVNTKLIWIQIITLFQGTKVEK